MKLSLSSKNVARVQTSSLKPRLARTSSLRTLWFQKKNTLVFYLTSLKRILLNLFEKLHTKPPWNKVFCVRSLQWFCSKIATHWQQCAAFLLVGFTVFFSWIHTPKAHELIPGLNTVAPSVAKLPIPSATFSVSPPMAQTEHAPSINAKPYEPAVASVHEPDKLEINSATATDFERLPGIGKKKAEAIVALREKKKKFTSIEQLMLVKGIGKKTLQKLKPHLVLSL